MSLFATEKVPQPMGITAVASVNVGERSISVRCSDVESGYAKQFWRTAFRALRSAEQNGWVNHATIWAATPSNRQAAFAVPADTDFQTLKFSFPKGEAAFVELISKPVVCTVFVDKSTGKFLNVSFRNRSGAAA
jgi:hypothetical protein